MKHRIKLIILPSIILLANACYDETKSELSTIEQLHGVMMTSYALRLIVTSTGCTRKEHFDFIYKSGAIQELTVVRIKSDNCRRRPHAIELEYGLSNIGMDKNKAIMISNPIKGFNEQN